MTCTHPTARAFPLPLVREFLRAFGVVTCPDCGQALRILGRRPRDTFRAVAEKPDDRTTF